MADGIPSNRKELLCPICQSAQLINWHTFFRQYVNFDHLINWFPIDLSQMTNCLIISLSVLPLQLRAMPADRGGNLGRPKLSFQLLRVLMAIVAAEGLY